MQLAQPLQLAPLADPLPGPPRAPQNLDAAGLTDVGRIRPTNEDSYLIATLQRSMVVHDASPAAQGWFAGEPAGTMLVVADGMGGQGGGAVASRVAVNTVVSYLLNAMSWVTPARVSARHDERGSLTGVREQLSSALVAGDSTVKTAGVQTGAPRMGTTLTMALVLGSELYVAHVGDTRCYLHRAGKLRLLTTDHTLAQQVAEASNEPLDPGSHLHHILWNSLGATEDLPRPQLLKLALMPGDLLLLCSDGLSKHVSDQDIASTIDGSDALSSRCGKLVERANGAGGSDNITVLLAKIGG